MISDLDLIVKSNDKELLKDYSPQLNNFCIKCPRCGSIHIVKNGTYKRKNKGFNNITIQKYLCKDCKLSFKELPLLLTSYSQLNIFDYLKIYLSKNDSNRSIAKQLEHSRKTIINIKHKFSIIFTKLDFLLKTNTINSLKDLFIKYKDKYHEYLFDTLSTTLTHSYYYILHL